MQQRLQRRIGMLAPPKQVHHVRIIDRMVPYRSGRIEQFLARLHMLEHVGAKLTVERCRKVGVLA